MEPLSAYWPFVRGIHRSPLTKAQYRNFEVFLDLSLSTVGQRRWRTAVSHLPTWRPPKQANKARPGLVYYNHHTLTHVYTQIDMGRRNSVPENCDLQSLNFVTRTLCIFGGRWRTQRCEVEDSVCLGFGGVGLQFPMHASIDLSRYISYVE